MDWKNMLMIAGVSLVTIATVSRVPQIKKIVTGV